MKRGGKHIISIILLLSLTMAVQAQVSVRANIDRDNILIGEPVSLTVEAYVPLGASVTWFPSDTIPHFDITRRANVDTSQGIDGKKLSQTLTITSFDSGQQYVPPFEILVDGQQYVTDSIPVNVSFTPFDPNQDYRDIKDIIEVENPAVKYIPWIIAGVAILSLGLFLFFIYRRKLALVKQEKAAPETLLSPYEEAINALVALSNRTNTNNGEIKVYYSEMNDILRKYVSRKFSLSTFQKTNEELIIELRSFGIPKDAFISLAQSLHMSDSVKFAKYHPTEDDNRENLHIVRSSIDILEKHEVSAV